MESSSSLSGVGGTSLGVARARAWESGRPDRLFDDPYAAAFTAAAPVASRAAVSPGSQRARLAFHVISRTRFYDDYLLGACAAGCRQVVLLAAGLDTRAYRLPWPPDTVIYEIDQPQVIEFKTRTLADLGAAPTADRRVVAVDLRDDWPTTLRTAGFDPNQPTAWSAEGLLGYLPPEAQDRLLDTITELSAPGSRLATESATNPAPGDEELLKERMQTITERWRAHGFDLDMAGLIYLGDRNEAAPYLSDRGWRVDNISIDELFEANGLEPLTDDDMRMGEMLYSSGTLDTNK
jgi:methyltransferase (TIGR00027 family)